MIYATTINLLVFFKHSSPCLICRDLSIINKEILVDESFEFRYQLLQLSDRGGQKYPSELALESLIIVWKILTIIQSNSELMSLLVLIEGQTRKILVTLAFGSLTGLDSGFEGWRTTCPSCNVKGSTILSSLVRSEANCLIANLVKNYNSSLTLKGLEKRKLKKFDS